MATLFLGGWDIPFWTRDNIQVIAPGVVQGAEPSVWITLATLVAFAVKTFFFILVFMIVRWTLPRFRYDQVMDLGWKFMLPVALTVVVVTSGTLLVLEETVGAFEANPVVHSLVLTVVNLGMLGIMLLILDRGQILAGSATLAEKRQHAKVVAEFHKLQEGRPRAEPAARQV
jgi:NADH-quinone oxidoreductase subunit H